MSPFIFRISTNFNESILTNNNRDNCFRLNFLWYT